MTDNERNRVIELQHKGYGYKRIASAIGLPVNTVKSFCSRHPIRDDEILESKGLCRNCRIPIEQTPHKRKKLFCSDSCRMAWWNAHSEKVNRKAYYTRTCRCCGKQFVQEIFARFNSGESMSSISRDLNARGIKGVLGGTWNPMRIRRILSNEKYLGNALLQKRYRNNHIDKKLVTNKGELPMYYAEGTHEPIIDKAVFDLAQERLLQLKQQAAGWKRPTHTVFTGLIRCGNCGNKYKRVTNRGKHFWNCTTYQTKGKAECAAKKIPEETLEALTCEVFGTVTIGPNEIRSKITEIRAEKNNVVVFCMEDGSEIIKQWKDCSRAESWTPEMKEQAKQSAIQARRKKK